MRHLTLAFCAAALCPALAARAEVEQVIGAPPASCRPAANARPLAISGTVTLGKLLGHLAASGCKQYLVPASLLGKRIQLSGDLDPASIERRLDEVLASAQLSSQEATVRRIAVGEPARRSSAPVELDIRCADQRCTITRASLEGIFADPARLASSARIVPRIEEGRPIGFQLFGVRPGSLFAQLGLVNGDTILRVNGIELANPAAALDLYAKLRVAAHISVQLERRDQAMGLEIEVR